MVGTGRGPLTSCGENREGATVDLWWEQGGVTRNCGGNKEEAVRSCGENREGDFEELWWEQGGVHSGAVVGRGAGH